MFGLRIFGLPQNRGSSGLLSFILHWSCLDICSALTSLFKVLKIWLSDLLTGFVFIGLYTLSSLSSSSVFLIYCSLFIIISASFAYWNYDNISSSSEFFLRLFVLGRSVGCCLSSMELAVLYFVLFPVAFLHLFRQFWVMTRVLWGILVLRRHLYCSSIRFRADVLCLSEVALTGWPCICIFFRGWFWNID